MQAPERAFQSSIPKTLTIAVVGINDFHGHLRGKVRKRQDGSDITVGGAVALKSYLDILRSEMKGRVLLIDAGDEWQGTLESTFERGHGVVEFFNRLQVAGAAIGNHEFDFGAVDKTSRDVRGVLKQRLLEAKYPYLASNIYEKKSKRRVNWTNALPSKIYSVEGVRIAVIGASTQDTPATTRFDHVKDLEFREPGADIKKEAAFQRTRGATAVLLTTHAGTVCKNEGEIGGALSTWALRSAQSPASTCSSDQEINQVLKKLPEGTVQGVIAGHTHQIVHHWLSGVPVMESEAYNKYFSILYLTFDRANGKLISSETRIEGPVPICERMFRGKQHCDPDRIAAGEDPGLTDAVFHGQKIVPDTELVQWVDSVVQSVSLVAKRELGIAERKINHQRYEESEFLNLMADTVRASLKADFAIFGNGGIRAPIDAGPITYEKVYTSLPFDNRPARLRLTGLEIRRMLEIASSGRGGYPGVSGLVIELIPHEAKGEERDLNLDGKKETWETKRLLRVSTSDGKELVDSKLYTVATDDYISSGGDRLDFVLNKVPASRKRVIDGPTTRDVVVARIEKDHLMNAAKSPLMDPAHPRLIFHADAPAKVEENLHSK
jgi:5'-nucleotidase